MKPICVALLFVALTTQAVARDAEPTTPPQVADDSLGKTRNVHACGKLFLAGQFTAEDLTQIKKRGIERVITLRTEGEVDWDEAARVRDADLDFVSVPFLAPETLTDAVFDKVRELLRDGRPTLLHCGSANRVGGVWLPYRVLDQGVPLETALEEAHRVGLRHPPYEERALAYVKAQQTLPRSTSGEASVRPGVNDRFLDPELDVDAFLGRFEVESREVFSARADVLAACGIEAGWHIADIGAGTGFYARLFGEAVGTDGWVYALDIAPRFVQHMNEIAREKGIRNITGILCQEDSITLPPRSVDMVFLCDTYHHLEFPASTLASIHSALKPGGQVILIDFERIPGTSREWVLGHVRADKATVQAEVEKAGFKLEKEVAIEAFRENYLLRFRKR